MCKQIVIFLAFFLLGVRIGAEEGFITTFEYGRMLYENPRGIGCVECHGYYGEGDKIASYTHKNQIKSIQAPRINDVDFKSFKEALEKGKRVMPKYYLTLNEIEAIYQYLQAVKNTDKP